MNSAILIFAKKELPVKKTLEERKAYAKVIVRAWVDEDFKQRLVDEPASVLKENGIDIPEGIAVRFVERKENEIVIPLPPRPLESLKLSDDELMRVPTRGSGISVSCP